MTHLGFLVGTVAAITLIVTGVIGLIISKRKQTKNSWSLWLIIFGLSALISAVINLN